MNKWTSQSTVPRGTLTFLYYNLYSWTMLVMGTISSGVLFGVSLSQNSHLHLRITICNITLYFSLQRVGLQVFVIGPQDTTQNFVFDECKFPIRVLYTF